MLSRAIFLREGVGSDPNVLFVQHPQANIVLPATFEDIGAMTSAIVNFWLTFYGLATNGTVIARTTRLHDFLM